MSDRFEDKVNSMNKETWKEERHEFVPPSERAAALMKKAISMSRFLYRPEVDVVNAYLLREYRTSVLLRVGARERLERTIRMLEQQARKNKVMTIGRDDAEHAIGRV